MNDPKINPDAATLIDPVKLAEAKAAAEKDEKAAAAQAYWEAWDRAGTRAFKGIVSRPVRLSMLKSALRRLEQEAEDE